MKSKILFVLLILITVYSSVCVNASSSHITDNAGLLNEYEKAHINHLAERIGGENGIDIQILTVYSYTGYSIQDYTDTYYDEHNFGYGSEKSGVLFMLSMSDRDWCISTRGSALYVTKKLSLSFLSEVSDGEYAEAFEEFIYEVNDSLKVSEQPKENKLKNSVIIGIAAGLISGIVTVLVMKTKMKTVRSNSFASDYIRNGSFNLKESKDIFLFSNVTRTLRQTSSSNSGGGVHRSSSGTTHGGSHGKF